jgi:putative FmdB family regulatory protein
MPIYLYKCNKCAHEFEKLVRLNDTPDCPACQSSDLERQFTAPAISTKKSRDKSFSRARAVAKEVKKEKDHAQAEYERNYIKDHS